MGPRPKTPRQAVGELMLTLLQLIDVLQIEENATHLSINFDGRSARIDIAHLDADGHLDRWLHGFTVAPNLETFGQAITLPPGDAPH